MGEILLQSDKIALFYTEPQDLEKVIDIEGQEENKRFVYVWSKERHLQVIHDSDEMHLVIKERDSGRIVGYVLLAGIDGEDKAIELRRITISEKGKGYGRESMRLIKKLCFEILKCHRLWLDLYEDNITAKNLYLSQGFIQEGLLRECKKSNDGYRSMTIMSMLDREYKSFIIKF